MLGEDELLEGFSLGSLCSCSASSILPLTLLSDACTSLIMQLGLQRTYHQTCSESTAMRCHPCNAADYEWPSSKRVSKECKDLVSKILVADPKQRIAIAEIQVGECHLFLLHPYSPEGSAKK